MSESSLLIKFGVKTDLKTALSIGPKLLQKKKNGGEKLKVLENSKVWGGENFIHHSELYKKEVRNEKRGHNGEKNKDGNREVLKFQYRQQLNDPPVRLC